MSISRKGTSGAWTAGTSTATCTIPTHAIGDKIVVHVQAKSTSAVSAATITTPSGWNLVASGNSGAAGSTTADLGITYSWAFERTASATNHTFSAIAVTNGAVTLSKADVFERTSAGYTWDSVAGVAPGDAVLNNNLALVGTLTIGAGDMLSVGAGLSSNGVTVNNTWAYSATGFTFGTVTKSGTDGSSNNANDLLTSACFGLVATGASGSVSLTAQVSLSGNTTGSGVIVRLREIAPVPPTAAFTATPNPSTGNLQVLAVDGTASTASSPATISTYGYEVLSAPPGYWGEFTDPTDPTTDFNPVATQFEDFFTGTNGAPWDAAKWTVAYDAGAGADATIQSNQGRLTAGGAAYTRMAMVSDVSFGDCTIRFSVVPNGAAIEQYFAFDWKGDGNFLVGNIEHQDNGYWMQLDNNRYLYLAEVTAGGNVSAFVDLGATVAALTTKRWFRIVSTASSQAIYTWLDGTPEPTSPQISLSDGTYTSGYISFGVTSGNYTTTRTWDIDDLVVF